MSERRRFPRLDAHVIWRSAGLHVPRGAAVDMSIGGMLVYSDDPIRVGAHLEIEILSPDQPTLELHAVVVRVDALESASPARFDVALEFIGVTADDTVRLSALLGGAGALDLGRRDSGSEPGVDEEKRRQVRDIEQHQRDQSLLQPSPRAGLAGSPDGNGRVREEDGDEEQLLHQAVPDSGARLAKPRNAIGRLRILFVTPYLPSPARFGGQRRLHGLIAGLAASHEVSVISLVDPSEDQSESVRATEIYCRHVVTVPNHRYAAGPTTKRLLQIWSLLSSRSYERLVHREVGFDSALHALLAAERFDVVHFEFPHMAPARPRSASGLATGPAFLLDEHNIEYDLARQVATAGRSALRRAYSAINWRKVHTEERGVWARFDGCTLTSARDEGMLLADAPETRTAVVPNGVDLDFFHRGVGAEERAPATLLFFGAIDYYPNTDAVLFFTREIFPLLRSRVPRVRLSIVGRRPPPPIIALRSAYVDVTGGVEDVRPHLERASVVIVPLRIGGGTRLKILEALAMGKAVVSTSVGAEGLDVVPERDLLVADDPEQFAAQIKRLLDDPDLAARLGAAGRRLVEAQYSWAASVSRLSAFYGEVIEARGAA